MRIPVVDQAVCIACEVCTEIASGTFQMNVAGLSEVFDPQGDDEDTIQQAIDACPVSCISWQE
jgi:ferredoxin